MVTKIASRLQNMHFGYKSCVSFTNISLSVTKMAFQFTKWHLVLHLSLHLSLPEFWPEKQIEYQQLFIEKQ